MIASIEALEAMPTAPTQAPTAIQAWLTDALPAATSIADAKDACSEAQSDAADVVVWRGAALGRFLANAGRLRAAVDGCERSVAVLADVPGREVDSAPLSRSLPMGLASPKPGSGDRKRRARRSSRPAQSSRN